LIKLAVFQASGNARVKLHLDITANRRISIIEPQNIEGWFRSRGAGAPATPI